MNLKKLVPRPSMSEKTIELGVRTVGDLMALGIVAFLIISWLLTAPLFHAFDSCRSYFALKANKGNPFAVVSAASPRLGRSAAGSSPDFKLRSLMAGAAPRTR